jgi:hypothetical protein
MISALGEGLANSYVRGTKMEKDTLTDSCGGDEGSF